MRDGGLTEVRPAWLFIATLAGLSMLGPFTIDAIFPAFAQLGADFGATGVALQQLISVYLLAYAGMSLFHGPLSDALGRKPVMAVGMAMYVLSSVGAALAPNLTAVLVCRALQGVAAGAGQIISRAQVRDVFQGERAQRTMAQVSMIFVLGPALAPIVGGLVLGWGSWRGVFWFQAAYGFVLVALVAFWMPETHLAANRTPLNPRSLFASMATVWRHPAGRRIAIVAALAFGGQFLLISAASMFIVDLLGRGENDFWMLFVPLIAGVMAGSWVAGRFAGRMDPRRLATIGYVTSIVGGVALVAFACFPVTAGWPWIVVPIPVFTFGISVGFPILSVAMLDLFPALRGAAASVQSFLSLICNAVVSGVLAPAVAFSMPSLMVGALAFVVVASLLWGWHLRVTRPTSGEGATMESYYWIGNEKLRLAIAPFGATLGRLEVRLADGTWRNIVLTRPDPDVAVPSYLGATVGRFANRLANARFTLDGRTYQLPANEGPNQLHGGPAGFDSVRWQVEDASAEALKLSLTSADGDQGYPGTLHLTASFSLIPGGAQVEFVATTDAPTVLNITMHPFFNLDGAGNIDAQVVQVPASRFTVTDDANIPTGESRDVTGLGLDLREPRVLRQARAAVVADGLGRAGGIDYNLIVDGAGLREHVRLVGPDGVTLVVRSDAPSVQLYDAGGFDGSAVSADGDPLVRFGGLAIEPQVYPDAPNHAGFPSAVLRPGEEYRRVIQWLVNA